MYLSIYLYHVFDTVQIFVIMKHRRERDRANMLLFCHRIIPSCWNYFKTKRHPRVVLEHAVGTD